MAGMSTTTPRKTNRWLIQMALISGDLKKAFDIAEAKGITPQEVGKITKDLVARGYIKPID